MMEIWKLATIALLLGLAGGAYHLHLHWARLAEDRAAVRDSLARLPQWRPVRRGLFPTRRKDRQAAGPSLSRRLGEFLSSKQGPRDEALRLRLIQAGLEGPLTYSILRFLTAERFGMPWAMVAILSTPGLLLGLELDFGGNLGAMVVCALLPGFVARRLLERWLNARSKTRLADLSASASDFLNLLAITRAAGQSTSAALQQVANETASLHPVLAGEIRLLLADLAIDPERAFLNMATRTKIDTYKRLARILRQETRRSAAINQDLRILAEESRKERYAASERRVSKLPTTLTVVMMALILPPMLVILLGPPALKLNSTLGALSQPAVSAPATAGGQP